MAKTFFFQSIFSLIWDLIKTFFYFPIWWYSQGLILALKSFKTSIIYKEKQLSLIIWGQNLFRPMYAQFDWQGRLISFFMRLILLVWKFFLMIFWIIFYFLKLLLWIILPIFVLSQIILNLF